MVVVVVVVEVAAMHLTVYSHMSSMSFLPSFLGMLYVHFPPAWFAVCSHIGSMPLLKRW